ncbi:MAG: hypothetical protein PHU26_02815 [Methanofollis liminatans]|jgi:hypothetical protein|uniref:Uncharacterized protein n=1 Tax=Methanofollis liminatans DSM 4140 TaxID=28892 RepID=J0SC72_9EURY|nr:hypothetical protein [Methanofollis liminatans]EJG08319.1 hypothetical protein Metli_2381 [Methanofollis liminatans DSM 4140]MDD3111209.1 hypothetical protein [Methanofollis liminatans]
MISTRKSIVVSLAGLLLAWIGLTLAWTGAVGRTDPASLAPVIAGTVLIFLPAILRMWAEDRERLSGRTALIVRGVGIAAGALVGGYILYLWAVGAGDAKLHLLLSPGLAAVAGIATLFILEKAAITLLNIGKEKPWI